MIRFPSAAACVAALAFLGLFPIPTRATSPDERDSLVMAPEGGRLDALDPDGTPIGPCALKHTDVSVEVTGLFTRVTLLQRYHNPYPDKIEAVYTLPMSPRAAVDRMKMTIGDRIVDGEVHERGRARAIYEAARERGNVASLLEQERPNIFSQSVANIEPGAEVTIEISYVELLQVKDGVFQFDFPMVVGPRYIPGSPAAAPASLPGSLEARRGLILIAPASLTVGQAGDVTDLGTLQTGKLQALLAAARPIRKPTDAYRGSGAGAQARTWYGFEVAYPDGSKEPGELFTDGTGQIGARWFFTDPKVIRDMGAGFAPNTNRVPDASRITPEPVKPGKRAGHDISVRVTIDTGGPGILDLNSALHEIVRTESAERRDGLPRRITLELKKQAEIPNRDFVLSWKQTAETIQEAIFTHTGPHGNFITVMLEPPARIEIDQAVARELIFVLDTSGSMGGLPIEKAKAVIAMAIDRLRPQDTFNLITFAGDTHILWEKPRPASEENRAEAQKFLATREGGGGTEMMKAIEAALAPASAASPRRKGSPAIRIVCFLTDGYVGNDMEIIDAVKRFSATTRVFSFGIGNSVNRFLLDGMANAGRGAVEYVLLSDNADEKVERFVRRVSTPVLTDVEIEFSPNLTIVDRVPARIPDLFDAEPLVVHARYTAPGTGTVSVRGNTGAGPFGKTIPIDLPPSESGHDTIATLWARAKVDELMKEDLAAAQRGQFPEELKKQVIALGETFGILTQYTSFVAVEKMQVTIGGQPKLVNVPVEMPDGVSYEGIFGADAALTVGRLGQGFALGYVSGNSKAPSLLRFEAGAVQASARHSVAEEPTSGLLLKDEAKMDASSLRWAADKLVREAVETNPRMWREVAELAPGKAGRYLDDVSRGDDAFLLSERVAVRIADLVTEGKLDDARKLADLLADRYKSFAVGVAMRATLTDNSLAPEERNRRIAELRAEAMKAIETAVRRAKIEHRLDKRLGALLSAPSPAPAPDGVSIVGGRVVVSVLTTNVHNVTLDALRKAGLAVESTAKAVNLVVGLAEPSKLEAIALVDGVRRIEPTDLR